MGMARYGIKAEASPIFTAMSVDLFRCRKYFVGFIDDMGKIQPYVRLF